MRSAGATAAAALATRTLAALAALVLGACGPAGPAADPAKPVPRPGPGSGSAAGSASSGSAAAAAAPAMTPATWDQLRGPIRAVEIAAADAALRARLQPLFAGEVGQRLERVRLRKALAAAMAAGGVADVSARGVQLAGGIKLIVDIIPQPKIRRVSARDPGGKSILLTGLSGAIFGQLDPARMDAEVARLRESYHARGYLRAEAMWSSTLVDQGEVDIVIEIAAGEPVTIGSIDFKGSKGVPVAELRKAIEKTLVAGDPVVADRLERARLELEAHYWERGYANIAVHAPKVPEAGRADLVFWIQEGRKFKIGTVKVTGVPDPDAARYLKLFAVKQGDVFKRSAIVDGRQRVADAAVAAGNPAANVLPLTKVDLDKQTIDLTLEVTLK